MQPVLMCNPDISMMMHMQIIADILFVLFLWLKPLMAVAWFPLLTTWVLAEVPTCQLTGQSGLLNSLDLEGLELNFITYFRVNFSNWWLRYLLWNCTPDEWDQTLLVVGQHWSRPSPELMSTQINVNIWHHGSQWVDDTDLWNGAISSQAP